MNRVVTFLVAVDVQKVKLFVWEPHVGVDYDHKLETTENGEF